MEIRQGTGRVAEARMQRALPAAYRYGRRLGFSPVAGISWRGRPSRKHWNLTAWVQARRLQGKIGERRWFVRYEARRVRRHRAEVAAAMVENRRFSARDARWLASRGAA